MGPFDCFDGGCKVSVVPKVVIHVRPSKALKPTNAVLNRRAWMRLHSASKVVRSGSFRFSGRSGLHAYVNLGVNQVDVTRKY